MPSIICNQEACFDKRSEGQPQPLISKGDLAALAKGFTKRVYIIGGGMEGSFLIHPDTDYDTRFKAWGIDWEEWAWVNGWNVEIEEE